MRSLWNWRRGGERVNLSAARRVGHYTALLMRTIWMGPFRWHQNMVTVAISFSHHFFFSSLMLAGTSSDTARCRCEQRDAGESHNVT